MFDTPTKAILFTYNDGDDVKHWGWILSSNPSSGLLDFSFLHEVLQYSKKAKKKKNNQFHFVLGGLEFLADPKNFTNFIT